MLGPELKMLLGSRASALLLPRHWRGLPQKGLNARLAWSRLENGLKALSPSAVIFGADVERIPNTTLFAVPPMKAETAVIAFDLQDVAVVIRCGLLFRQGTTLARPRGHGRLPGACPWCGAGELGVEHDRIDVGSVSSRLD